MKFIWFEIVTVLEGFKFVIIFNRAGKPVYVNVTCLINAIVWETFMLFNVTLTQQYWTLFTMKETRQITYLKINIRCLNYIQSTYLLRSRSHHSTRRKSIQRQLLLTHPIRNTRNLHLAYKINSSIFNWRYYFKAYLFSTKFMFSNFSRHSNFYFPLHPTPYT